jgi:hypothetical protein
MKGAIPISEIGNFYLRIADLVNVLTKPAILAAFERPQLEQVHTAMADEIERRKKKETT